MYNFECPVTPGQTVWHIYFRYVDKCEKQYKVTSDVVDRVSFADTYRWALLSYDDYLICTNDDWTKTAFPTREEAEAALKKTEEQNA